MAVCLKYTILKEMWQTAIGESWFISSSGWSQGSGWLRQKTKGLLSSLCLFKNSNLKNDLNPAEHSWVTHVQQLHYQRAKKNPALFPIVRYTAHVIKIVYVKKTTGKLKMFSLELIENENFIPVFVSYITWSHLCKRKLSSSNFIILQIQ